MKGNPTRIAADRRNGDDGILEEQTQSQHATLELFREGRKSGKLQGLRWRNAW